MTSPFHDGERAVQARAGVLTSAARVGGVIRPALPASAVAFLDEQPFAIVAIVDERGRVWASLLGGRAGDFEAADPHTLLARAPLADGDPAVRTLAGARERNAAVDVGLLFIDLETRRRLRVNGGAAALPNGTLAVDVRQAYWNCPKYIQQRRLVAPADGSPRASQPLGAFPEADHLTPAQRAWITSADTFFIASDHPRAGADASHRGGEPGFVRVERDAEGRDVLVFPDYSGNDMFNTFGNLAVNPAAGLLFLDFAHGRTLQLTGTAEVLWDRAQYADLPGAERAVRFRVAAVVETADATALRWRLVERSPFNPPAA